MIDKLIDIQVKFFLLFWYLPYYMLTDMNAWQKMGIAINGVKPSCKK